MKRLMTVGLTAALVSALALLAPTGARAAAHHTTTKASHAHVASPQRRAIASADRWVQSRPIALKATRFDRFQKVGTYSSHGLQYVAYQRTYKGLDVVGGDFVVNTDATGLILSTSVAQDRKVHLASTRATVSRTQARAVSARHVSGAKIGATRLVVLQRHASSLAWRTTVSGTHKGQPTRRDVYVSARTGRVLFTREHVLNGTGQGNWEGNVSFPTTQSGTTFSLTNPNATGLSCQNLTGNKTYTGPDDLWGNGVGTNRETGCVDAYYTTEQERLMLQQWDGRNGMNGSGGWVPTRVGLQDQNAFYDGTQVQIGFNTAGQWIGAIDVTAHEYGHGVDDKTPGSISRRGTQEFIADAFGASTEWFANNPNDAPDFLVGEEVNLVGSGPIRNMYNPSALGDPNCYSASIPNTEVHAAAGPGNHWFYLLAEGTNPTNGQPTSPTCNGSTITGIGVQKAQTILYNAMLMKTTASSYLKYRTWTLTAAKNLFPGSCTEFNTVLAAWNAVKVPAQVGDPTCTVSGNTVTVDNPGNRTGKVGVSSTALQMTATDSQAGQTFTWSATGLPPGKTIGPATGKIYGVPTTAGTYTVTVTATDTTGAFGSTTFTWTIT